MLFQYNTAFDRRNRWIKKGDTVTQIIQNDENRDETDTTQYIEDIDESENEIDDLEINPGPETALFFI